MKLIGMLDSPYVRRSAIAMLLLDLPFEHQSLSVFRGFAEFRTINPVVKAPTLVCDDGEVLMDSTLIIRYAEALAGRSLLPATLPALQHALQINGLALAVCEKSIQIVYEHGLRPAEKRHAPWLDRVGGQLEAGLVALEAALTRHPCEASREGIDLAGVSAAVAWEFVAQMTPDFARRDACPRLAAFSALAETLPEFRAAPHGDGVVTRA